MSDESAEPIHPDPAPGPARRPPLPTRPAGAAHAPAPEPIPAPAPPRERLSPLLLGFFAVSGLIALVLIGIIIANLIRLSGAETATAPPPSAAAQEDVVPGARAVDFTAPTPDGQTVRLSDYRGKNPVWLNFWASWCGPCKQEMPDMERLYQAYRSRGLVILGFDYNEDAQTVQNYVRSQGFSWLFITGPTSQTLRRYYIDTIPTHIFIDRAGIIQARIAAGLPGSTMQEQVEKILD